jgi:hypothetical protein
LFRPADFFENFAGGPGGFDNPEKAHELSVPMARHTNADDLVV